MRVQLEGEDEPVQVDPDQVEVEDDDPFLTQDEVDDIVQTRLNRQERNLKSELKDSDEFWQEMAQSRGIELREDGKPKGSLSDEEIEELRKKASRVDELEDKVQTYESEISGTRETKLENQVMQAANGVREDMRDVLMTYVKGRTEYNEEYGWHEVDENGDPVYHNGKPKGPDQVVSEMEESKPGFFKESSMTDGPDSTPTDESSEPKEMPRSEWEDLPAEKRKEFVDEGGQLTDE